MVNRAERKNIAVSHKCDGVTDSCTRKVNILHRCLPNACCRVQQDACFVASYALSPDSVHTWIYSSTYHMRTEESANSALTRATFPRFHDGGDAFARLTHLRELAECGCDALKFPLRNFCSDDRAASSLAVVQRPPRFTTLPSLCRNT